MISVEEFTKLFPAAKSPEQWVSELNKFLPLYEITTVARTADFLAQCGHESNGFTDLLENLNYSAKALLATWPKRFPEPINEEYARKPEAIANRAYANRMGNGPEASGDGWKHRGAGLIQLTGKENQSAFAKHAGVSLDAIGGYLQTITGAVHSACWFWKEHNCNAYSDKQNFEGQTKAINGGLNGYEDRKARREKAIAIFTGRA